LRNLFVKQSRLKMHLHWRFVNAKTRATRNRVIAVF
jgi:hypothetical protein